MSAFNNVFSFILKIATLPSGGPSNFHKLQMAANLRQDAQLIVLPILLCCGKRSLRTDG